MRIPTRDDVGELLGKTADWYARWLRIGLSQFVLDRAGRAAFLEVRNFVDQGYGSIASELGPVFAAMPGPEQEEFRDATAVLLQSLDFARVEEAKIALSVVELGAAIGARGLLPILAAKSFSMSNEHGIELFDLTFELSAQLADLDPEKVVCCLRHLTEHESLFQPAMVGRALIAMTQAQPAEFPNHFQFLDAMLERQYGYAMDDPEEEGSRRGARLRLVRGLARRMPDKMLLAKVPNSPVWWIDLVVDQVPEAANPASSAIDQLTWADVQAEWAERAKELWNEAINAVSDVWRVEGRRMASAANYPEFIRSTGAPELFEAISALGDTVPRKPSHKMSGRELQDDLAGLP